MQKEEIIQGLYDSVLTFDKDRAVKLATHVIQKDLDILEAIDIGLTAGIQEVGRRFQTGQAFIPELQLGADVLEAAMTVLNPELLKAQINVKPKGKVLLGTVKGDLHNIGKDLVALLLKVNGFQVIDLGVDISTFTFVEEAVRQDVNIIGLSALLTTTMPQQREVIEALKSEGLRSQYKVIIGGGSVDEVWADTIGADGYGVDAAAAVELSVRLCR